jgi:hypothetical protein
VSEDGGCLINQPTFRLIVDTAPSPQFIVDQNRLVCLYDSLKVFTCFDYYGAFKNRIQLKGWTDFTVMGMPCLVRDAYMLYRYESGTLICKTTRFRLPCGIAQK